MHNAVVWDGWRVDCTFEVLHQARGSRADAFGNKTPHAHSQHCYACQHCCPSQQCSSRDHVVRFARDGAYFACGACGIRRSWRICREPVAYKDEQEAKHDADYGQAKHAVDQANGELRAEDAYACNWQQDEPYKEPEHQCQEESMVPGQALRTETQVVEASNECENETLSHYDAAEKVGFGVSANRFM